MYPEVIPEEIRQNKVTVGLLIFSLILGFYIAESRYVAATEIRTLYQQAQENREGIIDIKIQTLEARIGQLEMQIYTIERLVKQEEANDRDRQRLLDLKNQRATLKRQLKLLLDERVNYF